MPQDNSRKSPVVIATWPFGLPASEVTWKALENGASPLDAVIAGVSHCEDDSSVDSVGYGGLPDASGEVTLDASVVDEKGRCGAVACLRRVRHAAQVARAVMDRTPHLLLVGEAATAFAVSQGFQESNLLSPEAAKKYEAWKKANPQSARKPVPGGGGHDTIGMLALARDGRMAGACTTSGRSYKLPGRVGDSPIIGAGLYLDPEVGGAAATGVGEEVIKVSGSYAIVVPHVQQIVLEVRRRSGSWPVGVWHGARAARRQIQPIIVRVEARAPAQPVLPALLSEQLPLLEAHL